VEDIGKSGFCGVLRVSSRGIDYRISSRWIGIIRMI